MLRKIDLMHKMFGIYDFHNCCQCDHFIIRDRGRRYFKCECYSLSSSEASDWRAHWTACGLYNKEYKGNPIMKLVLRERTEEQIEGQMSLFDTKGR